MSLLKPTKLEFQQAAGQAAKRAKQETTSPHKMASEKETGDGLREILSELRSVKELITTNTATLSQMQDDLQEMKGKLEDMSGRLGRVEAQVQKHEHMLTQVGPIAKRVTALEIQMEDQGNRARRNNIHITGIPEGEETNPIEFWRR